MKRKKPPTIVFPRLIDERKARQLCFGKAYVAENDDKPPPRWNPEKDYPLPPGGRRPWLKPRVEPRLRLVKSDPDDDPEA
jgi:hypothetical protein